uniref:Uncharacterized protein n=1 Tax=Poecilia mexicana TaxID=48701 RepID=A0A3B3Y4T8_9TELE
MDIFQYGLANLPMFPYFEIAHYIVSVLALREQQGASGKCARTSVFLSWFKRHLLKV